MVLINQATIDADGANTLTISTGSTVTNNALIESTNTGGLVINSTIDGSSGGTIGAFGGNVTLTGADLQGGVLDASNGGTFYDVSNSTLDGSASTLTNNADIVIVNQQLLNVLGTIANQGTITVGSSGYGTALEFAGSAVTLTGTGTLLLTDNGNNYVYGASAATTSVVLLSLLGAVVAFCAGLLALKWLHDEPLRAVHVPDNPHDMVRPAARHLSDLLQLGQIGYVRGIEAKLTEITEVEPETAAFTAYLRDLVRRFELARYMACLEEFLALEP